MTKYCWRAIIFLCADSSASPLLFVRGLQFFHTLESGNPERPSEKILRCFYCGTARLDSRFRVCEEIGRGSLRRSEHRRIGVVKDNNPPITPRHSRESGNPEAAARNIDPFFFVETPQWIPAFAGMTSICNAVRFLHTLFRGNDEVLFDSYFLSQHQYFGASAVMASAARFLHALFRGNDEE